ncbi:hypothetical protein HZB01_03435 [Candidatus Woesearchaeota archaeon]|nr:hypothetical protein [Candidatus Woesearchaeota archaeon]
MTKAITLLFALLGVSVLLVAGMLLYVLSQSTSAQAPPAPIVQPNISTIEPTLHPVTVGNTTPSSSRNTSRTNKTTATIPPSSAKNTTLPEIDISSEASVRNITTLQQCSLAIPALKRAIKVGERDVEDQEIQVGRKSADLDDARQVYDKRRKDPTSTTDEINRALDEVNNAQDDLDEEQDILDNLKYDVGSAKRRLGIAIEICQRFGFKE